MSAPFRDNVVVITGASDGIGRELALQLAEQGAWLALAARDEGKLELAAADCRARGGRAVAIPTDVGDAAQCRRLIDRTVKEYGRIDTLVNNAGISMWARLDEVTDLAPFETMMRVNYMGSVWCTHAALPHLKRSRGRIVGVSSLTGRAGVPTRSGYAASKHALEGYSESLVHEIRATGVRVVLVEPAYTRTSFEGNVYQADQQLDVAPLHAGRHLDGARRRVSWIRRTHHGPYDLEGVGGPLDHDHDRRSRRHRLRVGRHHPQGL